MPLTAPQPPPTPVIARNVWIDEGSYATTLLTLFIDTYGTEGLEWSPETILMQIRDDFGVEPLRAVYDRLMAAIMLVTTDYFYQRLSYFNQICNVLSGDSFDPSTVIPATVVDCAWGITEAMLIYPPDEEEPFTEEIRGYVAKALANEGFVRPPDILRIALDADVSNRVSQDFSEDPEMFSAIYSAQQGKNDEVTGMLRENLRRLVNQIESLPLKNGSAKGIAERLGRSLR